MTVRMPAKNGYPHKTLYCQGRKLIGNAKYEFIHQEHTYFGKHFEADVFGLKMNAYVYVDKDNALEGCRNDRHGEKLDFGTLQLFRPSFHKEVGTCCKPGRLFRQNPDRNCFLNSKEYLNLLPLSKWSNLTVREKILSDVISTIALFQLIKTFSGPAIST